MKPCDGRRFDNIEKGRLGRVSGIFLSWAISRSCLAIRLSLVSIGTMMFFSRFDKKAIFAKT